MKGACPPFAAGAGSNGIALHRRCPLRTPRVALIIVASFPTTARFAMSNTETMDGGCACGAIRYRIAVVPTDAGFCHCRLCQRTTGAAVVASASVPIDAFEYLQGEPTVYASSTWGERRFCGRCGAQLEYRRADAPKTVEINSATLDDPSRLRPAWHVWYADRFPGIEIADDLPKYRDGGPA